MNLQLYAKDGDYDIYFPELGFYVQSIKNQTKETGFKSPEAGTYSFECRDLCPITGKIKGNFIVVK